MGLAFPLSALGYSSGSPVTMHISSLTPSGYALAQLHSTGVRAPSAETGASESVLLLSQGQQHGIHHLIAQLVTTMKAVAEGLKTIP